MNSLNKQSVAAFVFIFTAFFMYLGTAKSNSAEGDKICKFKPNIGCITPGQNVTAPIRVPPSIVALQSDGLSLCHTNTNMGGNADIVLIMDNTGSMKNYEVRDGIPRYCPKKDEQPNDPGCISGDPQKLRGPALKTFVDSVLVKAGGDTKIGVVLFSRYVTHSSRNLQLLTDQSIHSIKSEINMNADGYTNYTAAFIAAMELLKRSDKPKSQQAIIFISDGRPTFPEDNKYGYKENWNEWPAVHSIFLGDNANNFKDMQDISNKTGGAFFATRDVKTIASVLTSDILPRIISSDVPQQVVVTNTATNQSYTANRNDFVFGNDSGSYQIKLPADVYLEMGVNKLIIQASLSDNSKKSSTLIIQRNENGPYDDVDETCWEAARLTIYNQAGQPVSDIGLPMGAKDKVLHYKLITSADLDSFNIELITTSGDRESQKNKAPINKTGNTWENGMPFEHQAQQPLPSDGKVQSADGDWITLTYRNPNLPIDTAVARVLVGYGSAIKWAAYYDLDNDGKIETVKIKLNFPITAVPRQFKFELKNAKGKTETRIAKALNGEIAFASPIPDKSFIIVTLRQPFSKGITSIPPDIPSGHVYRDDAAPISAQSFFVADSVAPIILKAKVIHPSPENPMRQLEVTFSEPVNLPKNGEILTFLRDSLKLSSSQVGLLNAIKVGTDGRHYIFELDTNAQYWVSPNDKVSLTPGGSNSDVIGNVVKDTNYSKVVGEDLAAYLKRFSVTSPDEIVPMKIPPIDFEQNFAIIDKNNRPLTGGYNSWSITHGESLVGPAFVMDVESSFKYRLLIYSNLGTYVTGSSGEVKSSDMIKFEKVPQAAGKMPVYRVRIVWNGWTQSGRQAGSGAYVIKAFLEFTDNYEWGLEGDKHIIIRKFGYIQ